MYFLLTSDPRAPTQRAPQDDYSPSNYAPSCTLSLLLDQNDPTIAADAGPSHAAPVFPLLDRNLDGEKSCLRRGWETAAGE